MLKKLLKYDLLSIFKVLVIFYSLSLIFALLARLFLSFENSLLMEIIGQICSGAAISMIFSIIINNLMRLWVRFKMNLYGDESYLSHTLPVSKSAHYISKALCAVITLFVSVLVIALSLFAAYYSKDFLHSIKNFLLPATSFFDASTLAILAAFLFILFLEFANILQCGFTGIILGHQRNGAKVGFSVLFGFIALTASQMLALAMIFITAIFKSDTMNIIFTETAPSAQAIKFMIILSGCCYILLLIIGFFVNIKLLKKGVNVE